MSEINRDGTINAIEWLEEESYKELYEKAKDIIFDMQQHYEYELEEVEILYNENKELKKENEELKAEWKKLMWEIYKNIQFQKSLEEYAKQVEEEEKAQK